MNKTTRNKANRNTNGYRLVNKPSQVPIVVGDTVTFENKQLKVLQIKGKALLVQEQTFPYYDFLVDSSSVVKS